MIKRIKEYLEYRKNKKIAKREFAKMAATTLPVIRKVSDKGADIVKFIVKYVYKKSDNIANITNNKYCR